MGKDPNHRKIHLVMTSTQMNMKIIALTTYVLIGSIIELNAQTLDWANSFGANSNDVGYSIAVDDAGNVYTTGDFSGTVDFDPGTGIAELTSSGNTDVFIQKVDADGNFLWAKSFGGSLYDHSYAIAVNANGLIYIAGKFDGIVDFDPGNNITEIASTGSSDAFIQSLDANGNFLWVKTFGGSSSDEINSLVLDSSSNIYSTGSFRNTVDFDPGVGVTSYTSEGSADFFLQKLDSTGNFLWAVTAGSTFSDIGRSVTVDNDGNAYVAGSFTGTVDFEPGTGVTELDSEGLVDAFILKTDSNGSVHWARSFGGNSSDFARDIVTDLEDNVYTIGDFNGTVDFDPGTGLAVEVSAGANDIFIQKLDSSGNFLWVKIFGGVGNDFGYAIDTDSQGKLYSSGYFEQTVDFDPSAGENIFDSEGDADIFIQIINTSGDFVWASSFGGSSNDLANDIVTDNLANIYSTGYFVQNVDFDPDTGVFELSSNGLTDAFIQKLSQCVSTSGVDVITACDSYTWIDGLTYDSSNNTATHVLTNAAGCDSLISLDLTIENVSDVSTFVDGNTIAANNADATYQWIDCDNNLIPLLGETNQTFTPTESGNYAVQLTENNCTAISDCVFISVVSVSENSSESLIKIFPNPTQDQIIIDLNNSYHRIDISIHSASGKIHLARSLEATNQIRLSPDLAPGLYFIRIVAEEIKEEFKLLIE